MSSAPILIYSNAGTDKNKNLSENKSKAGIYMFTNNKSGRIYIGSAFDLSERLRNYYSILKYQVKTSHIYNAIMNYGYSAFSKAILDYIT